MVLRSEPGARKMRYPARRYLAPWAFLNPARTGKAIGGKFLLGGLENAKPHALGIALPLQKSFRLGQNCHSMFAENDVAREARFEKESGSHLPSPGGGGSARIARSKMRDGGGDLSTRGPFETRDLPPPAAHFIRVDPPPPGQGNRMWYSVSSCQRRESGF